MAEQTLVLLKPDAVRRALAGRIIARFEAKNLRVVAMKMIRFDDELARIHYSHHVDKPFFRQLRDFICSGPCIAMVLRGPDAVELVRNVMGATSHLEAAPGTIRGDYASTTTENLVHGSDSVRTASREIDRFFKPQDLVG